MQTARLKPGITLYLVRHGETDWNKDARYQGQRDIPLNATGRAQAERNGQRLRALLPALADADFISSPLSRARETMQILRASLSLPMDGVAFDDRLMELHYGHWEGHLSSELPFTDPDGVAAKTADPFGWRPRGGESYEDLEKRCIPWIEALERDTLAVTHGGVTRVMRGALLGLDRRLVPALEVPQDRVLVLKGTTAHWL